MVILAGAAPASADPPAVPVTIAPPGEQADALEASLRELLGTLPVAPELARAASIDPREVVRSPAVAGAMLARVWIDLGSTRAPAIIYIADGARERVLVRFLDGDASSMEIVREEVAHIVVSALDALLSGGRIGVERAEASAALGLEREPPPPPPAPAVEPPRDRTLRWQLGTGWEAALWSSGDDVVTTGPLARLRVTLDTRPFGVAFELGAQYRLRDSIRADPVGARFDQVAVRLSALVDHALGSRLVVRAGLGVGVDVVRTTPTRAEGASYRLRRARTAALPMARVIVELGWRPIERLSICFALLGDVDLSGAVYVVESDGGSETVFDPWTVRPGLSLAVEAEL